MGFYKYSLSKPSKFSCGKDNYVRHNFFSYFL
jgi:hypothetical protein